MIQSNSLSKFRNECQNFTKLINELKSIIQISLHEHIRLSYSLGECSDALFALFNADTPPGSKEELIDSFEFLAAICIVSGMELHEKNKLFGRNF